MFFSHLQLLWKVRPHLVFRHKVYEIALSEVLATQMDVTEAQLVWIVQIWPMFELYKFDPCLNCTNLTHVWIVQIWPMFELYKFDPCLNRTNLTHVWIVQIWPMFELYKFDPFSPHSGSIPRELVHSYAWGCLWVVTVCCNTVGQHGRAFCRPHAYTVNEQSKMATSDLRRTDSPDWRHFRESHVTDGEPETAVSASLQKIKSIKNQHN